MTGTCQKAMPTFRSFPELADTARHIELVQAKLDQLDETRRASWEQILTAAARLYRADSLSPRQLVAFREEMGRSFGAGASTIWDAIMPFEIAWRRVWHLAQRVERDAQRDANGTWSGTFPLDRQPRPPRGTSVIYVLFDESNVPCYVGSTKSFQIRMDKHRKEKQGLRAWTAYPCRDRDHAYDLEGQLLRQYKPYMNANRGRREADAMAGAA